MKTNELTFPQLDIHFHLDYFWYLYKDRIFYCFEKDQLEEYRHSKYMAVNSFRDRMRFQEVFGDEIVRSKRDEKCKLLAIETVAEGTIVFSLKNELNERD